MHIQLDFRYYKTETLRDPLNTHLWQHNIDQASRGGSSCWKKISLDDVPLPLIRGGGGGKKPGGCIMIFILLRHVYIQCRRDCSLQMRPSNHPQLSYILCRFLHVVKMWCLINVTKSFVPDEKYYCKTYVGNVIYVLRKYKMSKWMCAHFSMAFSSWRQRNGQIKNTASLITWPGGVISGRLLSFFSFQEVCRMFHIYTSVHNNLLFSMFLLLDRIWYWPMEAVQEGA